MTDTTKPYKHQIAKIIRTTWDTPWVEVEAGLYPVFTRKWQGYEVQHTDGIGSKGVMHFQYATWAYAVQDALAMNLNDLLLVKARPVTLQNHIMLEPGPSDRHDYVVITTIVEHLAQECRKRQIAMTGGETSILWNMKGMDISITVTGIMERCSYINRTVVGNVVVGIPSSGIHSNGFTQIQSVIDWQKELLTPTRIYWDELYKHVPFIDGMMHITGGGWTKLLDILDPNHDILIGDFEPQDIFRKIHKAGVSDVFMYKTFNCGIGFIACVCKEHAKIMVKDIPDAKIIGEVVPGTGRVVIESAFSANEIVYE